LFMDATCMSPSTKYRVSDLVPQTGRNRGVAIRERYQICQTTPNSNGQMQHKEKYQTRKSWKVDVFFIKSATLRLREFASFSTLNSCFALQRLPV
jgi:hypothetical protein